MTLRFLNREEELDRLLGATLGPDGTFLVIYGRRRIGKSRLLAEFLRDRPAVYYVGDDREANLQRSALAMEIGRIIPGFEGVEYPQWQALLDRWHLEAPPGAILAIDELPSLVTVSKELPSLLQKLVDKKRSKPLHLVISGSSQRMMHGLVLDQQAPLYGRAVQMMRLEPLGIEHLSKAFSTSKAAEIISAYSIWGGIPRYWELARAFPSTQEAFHSLVLDPLGPLHHEPDRLLRDELRDTRQAASILALVASGCHRMSEIASRLGKPASSMTRPLAMLVEIGFVGKEHPFGAPKRSSKKTLYHVADPFLATWYRFVEPNRSLLEIRQFKTALAIINKEWDLYMGQAWEQIVRQNIPWLHIDDTDWLPASRWWGPGLDRKELEFDLVAQSATDPDHLLIGEVKRSMKPAHAQALLEKIQRLPLAKGKRISSVLFSVEPSAKTAKAPVHHMSAAMLLRQVSKAKT